MISHGQRQRAVHDFPKYSIKVLPWLSPEVLQQVCVLEHKEPLDFPGEHRNVRGGATPVPGKRVLEGRVLVGQVCISCLLWVCMAPSWTWHYCVCLRDAAHPRIENILETLGALDSCAAQAHPSPCAC